MAIQLNERDEMIFNLLEEHKVLLEKHIAWFISGDQKPVLIRDRLRKLFYLDYLLCQRHPQTLPWWTTPTKPLVYTLSPMAREIVGSKDMELDLNDSDTQRHLLEVANVRMLFMVAQKEGHINNFDWSTCSSKSENGIHVDAKISFLRDGVNYQVGILNHPNADETLALKLHSALMEGDIDMVWIVSREDSHQQALQEIVSSSELISRSCAFATHQELYKSGVVSCRWENSEQRQSAMFPESLEDKKNRTVLQVKSATA